MQPKYRTSSKLSPPSLSFPARKREQQHFPHGESEGDHNGKAFWAALAVFLKQIKVPPQEWREKLESSRVWALPELAPFKPSPWPLPSPF